MIKDACQQRKKVKKGGFQIEEPWGSTNSFPCDISLGYFPTDLSKTLNHQGRFLMFSLFALSKERAAFHDRAIRYGHPRV